MFLVFLSFLFYTSKQSTKNFERENISMNTNTLNEFIQKAKNALILLQIKQFFLTPIWNILKKVPEHTRDLNKGKSGLSIKKQLNHSCG